MMSQYSKSLAKEILLASGINHFEQTVYFHVRHREINDNPIYIIIIAVSRQEYCCMCGISEKDQTEEQCTWVFTMPFLAFYYFCKVILPISTICIYVSNNMSYFPSRFNVNHAWGGFMFGASTLMCHQKTKHGSPSWELELRPLGVATGNAFSVTRVWRYICKNTIRWPATAQDVTTGATIRKGPPGEYIISFSSSSLTGLFEETCILVGLQFSFIYHGEH